MMKILSPTSAGRGSATPVSQGHGAAGKWFAPQPGGLSDDQFEPMLAAARRRRSAHLGAAFLVLPPLALALASVVVMFA